MAAPARAGGNSLLFLQRAGRTTLPSAMRATAMRSGARSASTKESALAWPTTTWTCTSARLTILHCTWVLDQGELALRESSRAKVIVSEALWRVVERCVQSLGGRGVTGETLVARIFTDMRAFRIYDGPSEVYRWSLAMHLMKNNPTKETQHEQH